MSTEHARAIGDDHAARYLSWEACYNVRDLGGYPTIDGGRTRWRALLRADNLCRLTPAGRAALVDYGVRTVVDLRWPSEIDRAPHPFDQLAEHDTPVRYRNLCLLNTRDRVLSAALASAPTLEGVYRLVLDRCRAPIAAVASEVATAPEGGVLVHCHAGKDRTGVIVAILLALVGVPNQTIAEDYALSETNLLPIYEEELAGVSRDADGRLPLDEAMRSRPETMLATLAHLEARHGGAEAYLRAAGVRRRDLDRLRARLRE